MISQGLKGAMLRQTQLREAHGVTTGSLPTDGGILLASPMIVIGDVEGFVG